MVDKAKIKASFDEAILRAMAEEIRKLTGFNPENWEEIVCLAIKEIKGTKEE